MYKYFELRDQEIERQKSLDSQLRNELYVTLKRWRGTRRFFTGERGAWSSRFVEGRRGQSLVQRCFIGRAEVLL